MLTQKEVHIKMVEKTKLQGRENNEKQKNGNKTVLTKIIVRECVADNPSVAKSAKPK